jgi:hypothetical protein
MAAQDFIGIDSTAADPVQVGDTAAQIPTALYQRAEQNSRYLIEWRGPTCVWHYPADYSGGEGVGPSFPRLAFARWAAFGPFRYYVPDVGTAAISAVDVQIVGTVSTRAVRVAMVSNQGLGFIPAAEWLDANAQTRNVGDLETLFSGVAVVPGWNDLFLLLESEAEWTSSNKAPDWFLASSAYGAPDLSSSPVLVSTGGDLAASCPALTAPVPFVGVRFGSGLADKDQDCTSGPVCTIALANCDAADPPAVSFAFLAELNNWADLSGVATNVPGLASVYWSTLGTLQIYSVAVTPYANHPDKANDPTLRFLQSIGSNVANVYWKASRLNALRQTQVGSGVPRQLGLDYNGVWRTFANIPAGYSNEIIRETSISTRGDQPRDTPGAVSIEFSIPVIAANFESFGGSNRTDPLIFDCRAEIFNITTGAVADYIDFENLAVPLARPVTLGGPVAAAWWLRRLAQMTLTPDWLGAGANGFPWSHDGATTLGDLRQTFYPLILRLPLGDLATSPQSWKDIRDSGDLFGVRLRLSGMGQPFPNYIGFGALTARIDWGT